MSLHRVEDAAEAECYPDHDSRQDVSEVLVMPGQRVGNHVMLLPHNQVDLFLL